MEQITLFSIIICVIHLISVIAMGIGSVNGYKVVFALGKFFFYTVNIFAVGIMLYYQHHHLAVTPIMGMCIYMIIPGVLMLAAQAFTGDDGEITPYSLVSWLAMIVAVITLAVL